MAPSFFRNLAWECWILPSARFAWKRLCKPAMHSLCRTFLETSVDGDLVYRHCVPRETRRSVMSAAIHEAGRSDFIGVKHDFTDAYNAPSPRPLFKVYRNLDYKVPYHIEHFLAALTRFARRVNEAQSTRLVDIGCSYGINALMLKHGCRYTGIAETILDGDGPDENLQSTLRGRGDAVKDMQVI